MPPRKDLSIDDALRRFDHLTDIADGRVEALGNDIQLLDAGPGKRLLELGCSDSRQLFLIEGELELIADDGATHIVSERDAAARGPVSRLRPSRYQVTARTHVCYLMVEQGVLDTSKSIANGMLVEEAFSVSEPNELLDDTSSHPLIYDVFNDMNLGRVVVPSEASVAVRAGHSLHQATDDLQDFVEVLMLCPALTLKTMRAARNKQALPFHIRNPRDAVVALGIDETYALSVNCILRETLRSQSKLVNRRMSAWWERTMRIAAICNVLARMSERFDPHLATLIGLLANIAEPVMLGYADRHPDLADSAALDNVLFGNRAEIGRILLSMWGMPRELVDAATHSSHWGYDHAGEADYTDILLVAQWHASLEDSRGRRTPPIGDVPAFTHFGLNSPNAEINKRLAEAADSALARCNALLGD